MREIIIQRMVKRFYMEGYKKTTNTLRTSRGKHVTGRRGYKQKSESSFIRRKERIEDIRRGIREKKYFRSSENINKMAQVGLGPKMPGQGIKHRKVQEDKERVAGRVSAEDLAQGMKDLSLGLRKTEGTMKEQQRLMQANFKKGPGGGGGTAAERGVGAIMNLLELKQRKNERREGDRQHRIEEKIAREMNIIQLALQDEGCHIVEAERETYMDNAGLGQGCFVRMPCKQNHFGGECMDTRTYCSNNHYDSRSRREPRDWKDAEMRKREAEFNRLWERKQAGEEVTTKQLRETEPWPWVEPKCPIRQHVIVIGDNYAIDSYNAPTQTSAGQAKVDESPIIQKARKRMRAEVITKFAEGIMKIADSGNIQGTEEGRYELAMEAWQSHEDRFKWENKVPSWIKPQTNSPSQSYLKGYLRYKWQEQENGYVVTPTHGEKEPQIMQSIKHIKAAIDACNEKCVMTEWLHVNGKEATWVIKAIQQGITDRGYTERQERRREEQDENRRENMEGYRLDMDTKISAQLRRINDAMEKRTCEFKEPAVVHLLDKDGWSIERVNMFAKDEEEWMIQNNKTGLTSYAQLIPEIHKRNLDQIPLIGLDGEGENTILVFGTVGEELGVVITITVGFVPEELQGFIVDGKYTKTRDWELTDMIVGGEIRGPLVDLNILSLENDSPIDKNEDILRTGIEGLAARCLNVDVSECKRGSKKPIRYLKWDLMHLGLIASDMKVAYCILDVYIMMRSAVNLLVAALELTKAESLKTKTPNQIMRSWWGYTENKEFKKNVATRKQQIFSNQRDPKEQRARTAMATTTTRRKAKTGMGSEDILSNLETCRNKMEDETLRFIIAQMKMRSKHAEGKGKATIEALKEKVDKMRLSTDEKEKYNLKEDIMEDEKEYDPTDYIRQAGEFMRRCEERGIKKRKISDEELESQADYKRCKTLVETAIGHTKRKAEDLLPVMENVVEMARELETREGELQELRAQWSKISETQGTQLDVMEVSGEVEKSWAEKWSKKPHLAKMKEKNNARTKIMGEANPPLVFSGGEEDSESEEEIQQKDIREVTAEEAATEEGADVTMRETDETPEEVAGNKETDAMEVEEEPMPVALQGSGKPPGTPAVPCPGQRQALTGMARNPPGTPGPSTSQGSSLQKDISEQVNRLCTGVEIENQNKKKMSAKDEEGLQLSARRTYRKQKRNEGADKR